MYEYIENHLEQLAQIAGGVVGSLAELGDLADDNDMTITGREIARTRRKFQHALETLRELEVEEIDEDED